MLQKNKFMVFETKTRLNYVIDMPIYINDDEIECVHVFKYLGVILDNSLTFDSHIDYIYNESSKKVGAIRKVRECMDHETAQKLYKSLVLLHFDYCETV